MLGDVFHKLKRAYNKTFILSKKLFYKSCLTLINILPHGAVIFIIFVGVIDASLIKTKNKKKLG